MKYGNINGPRLDTQKIIQEFQEKLSNGEINDQEYKESILGLQQANMSLIVATNGGKTPKKQKRVKFKQMKAEALSNLQLSSLEETTD